MNIYFDKWLLTALLDSWTRHGYRNLHFFWKFRLSKKIFFTQIFNNKKFTKNITTATAYPSEECISWLSLTGLFFPHDWCPYSLVHTTASDIAGHFPPLGTICTGYLQCTRMKLTTLASLLAPLLLIFITTIHQNDTEGPSSEENRSTSNSTSTVSIHIAMDTDVLVNKIFSNIRIMLDHWRTSTLYIDGSPC